VIFRKSRVEIEGAQLQLAAIGLDDSRCALLHAHLHHTQRDARSTPHFTGLQAISSQTRKADSAELSKRERESIGTHEGRCLASEKVSSRAVVAGQNFVCAQQCAGDALLGEPEVASRGGEREAVVTNSETADHGTRGEDRAAQARRRDLVRRYGEVMSHKLAKTIPDLEGGGLRRSAGSWELLPKLSSGREHWASDERVLGSSDFVRNVIAKANADLMLHDKPKGDPADLVLGLDCTCATAPASCCLCGNGGDVGCVDPDNGGNCPAGCQGGAAGTTCSEILGDCVVPQPICCACAGTACSTGSVPMNARPKAAFSPHSDRCAR
jgi:hypothetical protein